MEIFNLFVVFLSLLVGAAIVFVFKFLKRYDNLRETYNKLPGPKDVFLFGNAFQMKHGHHDFIQLMEWCRKYKGIFRIWFGTSPSALISSPEATQKLIGGTSHMTKSYIYKLLHPWLGTGLLTSEGDKWKLRRKLITPAFHYKILNNFLQVFQDQADILVAQLQSKVNGEAFDIFPYIGRCTLDIICETSMGRSRNAQENKDSEYVRTVLRISDLIAGRVKKPWLWSNFIYNLVPSGREHKRCLDILHGFTNKVIDEKIQERKEKAKNLEFQKIIEDFEHIDRKKKKLSFLDLLVECFEEGKIDREGIREEVDTFMFEGHDTTAAGISWALYLLGRNPEIQEKVYEEVQEFFGCHRDEINMEDLRDLKYLELVMKESLRLFPPVPFFARTLTENCTVGDYSLLDGHLVGICSAGIHRDPELWPDPMKFDPDRFLPENSENRHPFAYLPFSAGPRNCIGQRFAIIEEKVILLNLIRHFRIESTQSLDEVKPCRLLVLRPKDGIFVKLTQRQ